jgi:hypothetical protein
MRLEPPARPVTESNHVAWLWVLGFLIAAVLGFSWYLHAQGAQVHRLPGAPPSAGLQPVIDPILAPLEAGAAGLSTSSLDEMAGRFRNERAAAGGDTQELYGTAITITEILREALADRERHLERLDEISGPASAIGAKERKHLELAVGVSWQRNSGSYRDRVEELWGRLMRMEYGRGGVPPAPPAPPESTQP